jgi:hypothetical protein
MSSLIIIIIINIINGVRIRWPATDLMHRGAGSNEKLPRGGLQDVCLETHNGQRLAVADHGLLL